MHKHEDAEIVAKILAGNIDLYAELMDKYRDGICAIAAKRVPVEDVAGVVHDIFVAAYQSLETYSGKAPFGNWAARIAIRICYAYWRDKYRRRKRVIMMPPGKNEQGWLEHLSGDETENEAEARNRKQDAEKLSRWLLTQLSPEDKTLIECIYFDDMPLKDVAEALEWSLAKTKVRAMRARKKMRKLLESIGESV